jgi:hypothetical protein
MKKKSLLFLSKVLFGILSVGLGAVLLSSLNLSCISSQKHWEAVKTIKLEFPSSPTPLVENIGRIFSRQVHSRCEAQVITKDKAPLTVKLSIEPGIGAEGFKIADGKKGTILIIGNDERGLLFGVGKFLHTSTYGPQGFTPGSWRGVSVPAMPIRVIYFATHFQNYYQVAPIEEVKQYVEDLSLWGVNGLLVWFGMEEFTGIDDPKAQAMLERLRALLKTAKDLGLNACLGSITNDGYKNSPVSLRAEDSTVGRAGYHTEIGGNRIYNLGQELCPSKPGVPEMEMGYMREKFEAFKSVGLDYWFFAPYDNGGCTCSKCSPWGINGYLRTAEPLARDYRRAFPNGKVILSVWYFDRWAYGEWEGITAKFNEKKPDWVDYIMADNFEEFPRYPLDHGSPGGLPMLNFPDISMWGQNPWGGYGANPQPGRLQDRWNITREKLSGGSPYSEGIYEDLNKVICAQLYWSPDRPAMETVKDYIAFEFSPQVVDDISQVVTIFEKNHLHKEFLKENQSYKSLNENTIGESAVTAYQLMEQADTKLTPQALRSWRWRLFHVRATIDNELYRDKSFQARDEVFQQAHDELIAITHAQNAWSMMVPPVIHATKPIK